MNSRNILKTVFPVLLIFGFIVVFVQPQSDTVALADHRMDWRFGVSEAGPTSVRSQEGRAAMAVPNVGVTEWDDAQPLPHADRVARYGHAQCAEDPDSFYLISGFGKDYTTPTDKVWRFDAADNQWIPLADIPAGQGGISSVCYDGNIYVLGGGKTNQFYIYDIDANEWASAPPLPRNVWGAAAGAYGGFIYLIGGDDDSGVSNQVDIYDISAGAWIGTGAPMPAAAAMPGFAQAGKYLYVVGGWGDASPVQNLNRTLRYNMKSDSWEEGPAFTSARADLALAVTASHLYAIGGDADGDSYVDPTTLVEKLDHTAWPGGSWQAADPLPEALTAFTGGFCTGAAAGGEVWSVAGYTGVNVVSYNRYLPAGDCFREFEPVLSGDVLAKPGPPEATVTYTLSLENLGNARDIFTLSLADNTWVSSIGQTEVALAAGTGAQVTVQVTVPADANEDDRDTVTFKAVSRGDPGKEASVSLTTTAVWKPVAAFQASASSVRAGDMVAFTNTSVGIAPITYLWEFGDGTTSADENPTHTFDAPGLYTVTLTAANSHGSDTFERTISVVPVIDLAIELTISPLQVRLGQPMTLTIEVTNLSDDPATGVIAAGEIPEFVQVVGSSEICSPDAPLLACDYGVIDGGASKTAWVTLILTGAGVFEFGMTVSSNEEDPDLSNNTGAALIQIYHTVFMPVVARLE